MRRLSEGQFRKIAAALLPQVPAAAPEWVDVNESDPGVTLLEIFAFLTESLLYRQKQTPARGDAVARRLADAALELTGAGRSRAACGLRRVDYFAGQRLNAKDFTDEQNYFRGRLRRLNRLRFGAGVVSGLKVSVAPGKGGQSPSVVVGPGFAVDPRGEEIEVCAPAAARLPAKGTRLLVQLLFAERLAAPVPAPAPAIASRAGVTRFSRVEETFAVVLAPVAGANAVAVARLTFSRGRWRVDPGFKPPRARK